MATPAWAKGLGRSLPGLQSGTVWVNYAFGQDIFTPKDIRRSDPDPDDRPYAGLLYGSVGLVRLEGPMLDQIALTAGVVGPAALAEPVQNGAHDVLGDNRAEGFHYQLHDEPVLQLAYRRTWQAISGSLKGSLGYDVSPDAEVTVGNLYDHAGLGATARIGTDLRPDNLPDQADPALPGAGAAVAGRNDVWWYVFAGVHGRALARNLLLDGNTFRGSRSVDRHILVGDLSGGLAVNYGRLRVAYTQVLRSSEFDDGRVDTFGMLTAGLQW